MPQPRPGESEEDFLERCIPYMIDREGKAPDVAKAMCYSYYESKGERGMSEKQEKAKEQDEKFYGEPVMVEENEDFVPFGVYSFADLVEIQRAENAICEVKELTGLLAKIVENILYSEEVADKATAIGNLLGEYQEKVSMAFLEDAEKQVGQDTKVTFDDSDWSGSASNWDTAEAYCKDCLIDLNDGGEKTKSLCMLPYRKPGSQNPNKSAIRTMATGRGLPAVKKPEGVSQEKFDAAKKKAANKLISWWKPAFGTSAPESIYKIAGKTRPEEKGILDTVKGMFQELKELLAPHEPEPVMETQNGIKTFEAQDGNTWLLVWTTNAFIDREKEIFTTKSIQDFVERHEQDDTKGEFWFWHNQGTKFGDIKLQAVVGRFLIEAGPFDDTVNGRTFKEFFQEYPSGHPDIAPDGWGASHGYTYNPEDRKDGVYDWFEKHETSVLPRSVAANPYTNSQIMNK